MQNLQYPLDFKFKITTFSSDFNITDRHGNYVAYVREKIFKLKDDVQVFSDESKTKELFRIKANQWIDFNASFSIKDSDGNDFGTLARKGMRSIWKSHYDILDQNKMLVFTLTEENPWVKVLDSMVGEIPIIGAFTGYFFNPTYVIQDKNGQNIFRLKKMPSLIGRRFQLDRLVDVEDEKETLVVLSLLMMVLIERAKG